MKLIRQLGEQCAFLPSSWATLVQTREQIQELLKFDQYIDLMIPRGSNELVQYIMENTKIPVLGHADGICHIYIDESMNEKIVLPIVLDAKTQYPSACNSLETLLLHENINIEFINEMINSLRQHAVRLFGCDKIIKIDSKIEPVKNWAHEYGDLQLSIKIVSDLDAAIEHINTYGSGHTDCIITECEESQSYFFKRVDSASVMHNCSTRFADGFRYGFGAEVGISTAKTHARGPVGIEGLLIYKYELRGTGQIVDSYTGKNAKKFSHKKIKQ
ncbi:MAG: glutamate-5-semialdehyde dehydrogenase [Bdellovibrionales bacterium]